MFSRMKATAVLFLAISAVFSCTHTPPSARLPSSAKDYQQVFKCGVLNYSESSYNTVDSEDIYYNLNLDCNGDRQVNKSDQRKVISIPVQQLSPQQKGWITRWTVKAQRQSKKLSARPYVCAELTVTDDPCQTGNNVIGYRPRLTSNIK